MYLPQPHCCVAIVLNKNISRGSGAAFLDGERSAPALSTPPTAQDLDASEKDLGQDGFPALTPPTASDLDKTKTSDTSMDTSNQTTTGPDLSTNHAFSNQITIM